MSVLGNWILGPVFQPIPWGIIETYTGIISCALLLQMDQEIRRNNDHSDHYVVKIEMILFNMNHIEIFELERDPDEMYH